MKFWFLSHVTLIHLLGIQFYFAVYIHSTVIVIIIIVAREEKKYRENPFMVVFKNIKYQQVGVCYRALLSLSPSLSYRLSFLPSPSIYILPVKNSFFSLLFSSRVSSTFFASKPQKSHCRCYYNSIALALARSVLIPFSNSNHRIYVVDKHLFGVLFYFIYIS